MKKTIFILLMFLLIFMNISFKKLTAQASQNDKVAPLQTYLQESKDDYYKNASLTGLSGNDLLEQLAKLMSNTHRYYTSYDDCRGAMSFADEDLNDPNKVMTIYAGVAIDHTWGYGNNYNREHIWCKNLSGGLYDYVSGSDRNAGTDIHQLKPSIPSINSTRSNYQYADLNKTGTQIMYKGKGIDCYYTNNLFEPRDEVKGDIARILMYMYTHYSTQVAYSTANYRGDLQICNIVYTKQNTPQAAWDLLLKWSEEDPVDTFESKRNTYCASITGVRNPYIDYPLFANMIWDLSYSGEGAFIDQYAIQLDESEISLHLSKTYQMAVSSNLINPNYQYYSTNENVATVNENGIVEAIYYGKCHIIVKDGVYSQCLKVTVLDDSQRFIPVFFYLNDTTGDLYAHYSTTIPYGETIQKPKIDPCRNQYRFVYWSYFDGEEYIEYDFSTPIVEELKLYAIWQSTSFIQLVNHQDLLELDATYILVAKDKPKALSVVQNKNNRAASEVIKKDDQVFITDSIQRITLKKGVSEQSYALQVDAGQYLYAAGVNSGNYLRTSETLDKKSSFTIEIAENGIAKIKCIDTNVSRNTIRYNVSNDLFSCYSENNNQLDVCLYKMTQQVDFSLNYLVSLSYQSVFNEQEHIGNYNIQILVSASLNQFEESQNYGYVLTKKSSLGNQSLKQVVENGEVALHELSSNSLAFTIQDIRNLDEVYCFAFYCKIDEKIYLAEVKEYSLKDIIQIYLEYNYVLDDLIYKQEIMNSLNHMNILQENHDYIEE